MTVKLLTEHHLEFLSLKGGCTGSSDSTLVKTPQCWKSPVAAQMSSALSAAYELWVANTMDPNQTDSLGAA